MRKEKIIQIAMHTSGQIIALSDKGRIYAQIAEREDNTEIVFKHEWFEIINPIKNEPKSRKNSRR